MSDQETQMQLTLTFLPASADGTSLSSSPAGQAAGPSGPGAALASRSASPDEGEARPTSGTSGPSGSGSSASADLQLSLANRLQARLEGHGSTLYSLTWKVWDMPAREPICAQRASGRRTSGSGYTGWPSCQAHDAKGGSIERTGGKRSNLADDAFLSGWPTSAARDWKSSASNLHGVNARPLNEVSRLAGWPTTRAADGVKGVRTADGAFSEHRRKGAGADLPTHAALSGWCSPMAQDHSRGGKDPRPQDTGVPLSQQAALAGWGTPAAQEAGGTPEQFLIRKRKARSRGSELCVSLTSLSLQASLVDHGPVQSGGSAVTAKRGQLNPEHSLWLQAFPAEWLWCAPESAPRPRHRKRTGTAAQEPSGGSETPSSPRSRRSSFGR